jgi:maleylacetoacetate isomerase
MIRLYDYPDCPFCQKVRVVLAEKDLEYEAKAVDLRAGEQRTPEFLKLNPYGKVPVLVDDETVVYDSTIINEYLEDEYPHPELLPEDSASRAKARLLEDYCDTSFIPSADFVILQLSKPEGERDEERLKRYQLEVERGLARLEASLAGKEYLVGSFSLADVAFAPRVLVLPQLGVDVDPRLRQVIAWIERLRERPSVKTLGL